MNGLADWKAIQSHKPLSARTLAEAEVARLRSTPEVQSKRQHP